MKAALARLSCAARLQSLHAGIDELGDLRLRIETDHCSRAADFVERRRGDSAAGRPRARRTARTQPQRQRVLVQMEQRERERTGISSLKVRFNSVFGYYLEISKANQHLVPADYERRQTLVNAERFTTPELKEYEARFSTPRRRSSKSSGAFSPSCARRLPEKRGASGRPRWRWPKWMCWRRSRISPPCATTAGRSLMIPPTLKLSAVGIR